jgi:hypothetical protein
MNEEAARMNEEAARMNEKAARMNDGNPNSLRGQQPAVEAQGNRTYTLE